MIHVHVIQSCLFPTIIDITSEVRERVRVMVFNATFNNISAISWWSVLCCIEHTLPERDSNSQH